MRLLVPSFALGIVLGALGLGLLRDRESRGTRADDPGPAVEAKPEHQAVDPSGPTTGVGVASGLPVLAVLPFTNSSPDPENAFFADGVHEDLIINLSRLSRLRVIGRTSVMSYGSNRPSLSQIVSDLRATHVVEGSVRRVEGRVRISAQLIDGATAESLWANRFDRSLDDIFAIQSQVADEIAFALAAELSPAERARIQDIPTRSVAAYDLFLKAREKNRDRENSEANLREGIRLLREAVALDPGFSEAWSLAAWYLASLVHFGYGDPDSSLAAAESALARAEALAPDRPATLLARAYVQYHGRREYEAALQTLSKAAREERNDPEILAAEAFILRRLGRLDESLERLQRAIRLDPRNSALLQQTLLQVRVMNRPEEALDLARRLAAFHPEDENLQHEVFGLEVMIRPDRERIREWAQTQHRRLVSASQPPSVDLLLTVAAVHLLVDDVVSAETLQAVVSRLPPALQAPASATLAYLIHRSEHLKGRPSRAEHWLARMQDDLARIDLDGVPSLQHRAWVLFLRLAAAVYQGQESLVHSIRDSMAELLEAEEAGFLEAFFLGGVALRADLLINPERAYEIYAADQERAYPFLHPRLVAVSPLDFAFLLLHPRFQEELAAFPDHLRFVREVLPDGLSLPW